MAKAKMDKSWYVVEWDRKRNPNINIHMPNDTDKFGSEEGHGAVRIKARSANHALNKFEEMFNKLINNHFVYIARRVYEE